MPRRKPRTAEELGRQLTNNLSNRRLDLSKWYVSFNRIQRQPLSDLQLGRFNSQPFVPWCFLCLRSEQPRSFIKICRALKSNKTTQFIEITGRLGL